MKRAMPEGRRFKTGTDNPAAKLTADQVRRMRELRRNGWTTIQLCCEFGVCREHVSHIVNRRLWAWLDD
jgi:hypothetical protein